MDPESARQLHEQRLRDGRRLWPVPGRLAGPASPRPRGRFVRGAIGRTIVRIGTAIAAEPHQPAASR